MLMTFKRYLMISKNTSSELVCDMIEDYYDEIAARKKHNAAEKWFARREDREQGLLDKVKTTNYLRVIPNSWCESLKQQCRLCYTCKNFNRNDKHMWEKYKIDIASYKRVWQGIRKYHDTEVEKHKKIKTIMKLKREAFWNIGNLY